MLASDKRHDRRFLESLSWLQKPPRRLHSPGRDEGRRAAVRGLSPPVPGTRASAIADKKLKMHDFVSTLHALTCLFRNFSIAER